PYQSSRIDARVDNPVPEEAQPCATRMLYPLRDPAPRDRAAGSSPWRRSETNLSELAFSDAEHIGMCGVQDIGQLEGERWRPRPLLLLVMGSGGDTAQHQQHHPPLQVVGAKDENRILGQLPVSDGAVGLIVLGCEVVAQRIRRTDRRFVSDSAAIAGPHD